MTSIPNTLTVRPDFPAKTMQEFIAYARANPDKLNFASQGTGTTSHLTAELFARKTGTRMLHVPYRGTAPAINDLIAGHVDMMFTEMASAIELHKAGKARILAVATAKRVPLLPDIPTFIESGVPDFEFRHLERDLGPAEDPGSDRRQAQRRDRRYPQDAGRAGAPAAAQHDARSHDPGAGRRLHQDRHAALGRRDQGREFDRRGVGGAGAQANGE